MPPYPEPGHTAGRSIQTTNPVFVGGLVLFVCVAALVFIIGLVILSVLPDRDGKPTPTTWTSGDGDTVRVLP